MHNSNANPIRRYLTVMLVAATASLILVPPNFAPGSAAGSSAIVGNVTTPDLLTIAIAAQLSPQSDLGVAAVDLKTGKRYELGGTRQFDAASTQKISFAAYLYHLATNGDINLDAKVTIPAADVQHYGTGPLQYKSGPLTYTYRQLTEVMLKQSDNTAAFELAKKLDAAKIQDYVSQLGLTHTSVKDNTTTPDDMLILMQKLYAGKLASPTLSDELRSYMTNTDFEDRLSPGLPKDAKLIHKTGDAFDGGVHDVGFVEYKNHAYAVSVFTRHVDINNIPNISRYIFTYFTR